MTTAKSLALPVTLQRGLLTKAVQAKPQEVSKLEARQVKALAVDPQQSDVAQLGQYIRASAHVHVDEPGPHDGPSQFRVARFGHLQGAQEGRQVMVPRAMCRSDGGGLKRRVF